MSTEVDVFQEMDKRDQLQIVQETMGEIVKDLFYDVNGKKGLSYAGVNTTAFFMGDIKTESWVEWERFEMNDRFYWSATVRAVNETYNLASLGTAEVPEMMEIHDLDEKKKWVKNTDGSWKMHLEFDRFCRRKALSMSQRNAKRAVMPEGMLEAFLKYFIRRAAGEKNLEPPFNPKKISSDYKVLPDQEGGEERREKTPPPAKTPAEEKPSLPKASTTGLIKPSPPAKESRLGKVNLDIIAYNLKALGYGEKDITVSEERESVIVEPARDISEAEQYKISGTLEPMGATWEEVGYRGRWKIQKKEG